MALHAELDVAGPILAPAIWPKLVEPKLVLGSLKMGGGGVPGFDAELETLAFHSPEALQEGGEEECRVLDHRTADNAAELVAQVIGDGAAGFVGEPVIGVQVGVAEEAAGSTGWRWSAGRCARGSALEG